MTTSSGEPAVVFAYRCRCWGCLLFVLITLCRNSVGLNETQNFQISLWGISPFLRLCKLVHLLLLALLRSLWNFRNFCETSLLEVERNRECRLLGSLGFSRLSFICLLIGYIVLECSWNLFSIFWLLLKLIHFCTLLSYRKLVKTLKSW